MVSVCPWRVMVILITAFSQCTLIIFKFLVVAQWRFPNSQSSVREDFPCCPVFVLRELMLKVLLKTD